MKQLQLITIFIFIFVCFVPQSFSSIDRNNIRVGYLGDNNSGTPFMVLESDISSGDFIFGTAVNVKGEKDLFGYESFVIRYLEYNDGSKGLLYEPLENTTFGYGLILSDLNSTYTHPIYSSSKKNALRAYFDADSFSVNAIKTYENLYAIELSGLRLLNVSLGLEYAQKNDGFPYGSSDFLPNKEAYGVYATYPLAENLSVYSEFARTSSNGEGASLGLSFDYELFFLFAHFRIEGRSFNPEFIPGYFTSGYYINPIHPTSYEASGQRRDGTFASVSAGALGFLGFTMTYENYTDSTDSLSLDFIVTPLKRFDIKGFIKQPIFRQFRDVSGDDSTMMGGSLEYRLRDILISVNYKKGLLPDSSVAQEATYVDLQYLF